MKKFILPLLVLLFVGSLFAVESAPSDVVGYVKYDCSPGLNLVALPLNADYDWATMLGVDYPEIVSIQRWTGNSWYAVNYDPDWGWDDDFAIDNTSVLFIQTSSSMSMYSLGEVPSVTPQFNLVSGLNTMYLPLNKASITNTEELGVEIPEITSIQKWTGNSWYAVNYDEDWGWDDLYALSIGMPMFVFIDGTVGQWPSSRALSNPLRSSK